MCHITSESLWWWPQASLKTTTVSFKKVLKRLKIISLCVPLSSRGRMPLTVPLLASLRSCRKAKEHCFPGPFHPATQPNTPTGRVGSKEENTASQKSVWWVDSQIKIKLSRIYSATPSFSLRFQTFFKVQHNLRACLRVKPSFSSSFSSSSLLKYLLFKVLSLVLFCSLLPALLPWRWKGI